MSVERLRWAPELARVYGLKPWDLKRLTLTEFRAFQAHHAELQRED